jgi:hypothetical protein
MALQPDGPGAYAPPRTTIGLVERWRDRGLPTPITTETLVRAGVSTESLAPRIWQALRLFDLIDDDGQPTDQFIELRKVPSGEYKERLASILRVAYADVLAHVDPAKDDYERIRDTFRAYRPPGVRDRMVTLFLGLSEYVGMISEARAKELANRSRSGSSGTRTPRATPIRPLKPRQASSGNGSGAEDGTPPAQHPRTPGDASRSLKLKSGSTLTLTLSAPLLLAPKEDRDFVLEIIEKMEDYENKIEASTSGSIPDGTDGSTPED